MQRMQGQRRSGQRTGGLRAPRGEGFNPGGQTTHADLETARIADAIRSTPESGFALNVTAPRSQRPTEQRAEPEPRRAASQPGPEQPPAPSLRPSTSAREPQPGDAPREHAAPLAHQGHICRR
ncbi:hypothetical protein AAFF_G00360150 [Aldrovandia affinis]|uniref:Uncharacterized protein n=1 Tax=Aldrovandia affinis TaxID=143900 RepID=A0AAD7SIA4_9TELE|nr:hypothetical protein AAFF_G00360150 [Aldrovandia affinis]